MKPLLSSWPRLAQALTGIVLTIANSGHAAAQKPAVTKAPKATPAARNASAKPAPKPLYRDPIYDGAADPVIVWNKLAKKWWMFYTNRRATNTTATGVTWVHGTRIGIAESADGGTTWTYRDTANIANRPDPGYTHWAPDIVEDHGTYHMFLTYVPGIFTDWNRPHVIVQLTSPDLLDWKHIQTLPLVADKVIDASVFKLPDDTWRLWYNNERDHKSIYYADSPDLRRWTDHGQAQPERLLKAPGQGRDDQAIGGHPDVVVSGNRAFLFYFTHPGRSKNNPAPTNSIAAKRSVIQVTALEFMDGKLARDRDRPAFVRLMVPR